MKMTVILTLLATLVAAVLIYVRLAPSDPAVWHVDPLDPAITQTGNGFLLRADGDAESPEYPLSPDVMMARLDTVAQATERVTRLAGSVAEGHITYVVRSKIMGYPDYVSVRAIPAGETGAQLVIWSRARFGGSDHGVNRARIEAWLAALEPLRATG